MVLCSATKVTIPGFKWARKKLFPASKASRKSIPSERNQENALSILAIELEFSLPYIYRAMLFSCILNGLRFGSKIQNYFFWSQFGISIHFMDSRVGCLFHAFLFSLFSILLLLIILSVFI